jgi:hypothetical protein
MLENLLLVVGLHLLAPSLNSSDFISPYWILVGRFVVCDGLMILWFVMDDLVFLVKNGDELICYSWMISENGRWFLMLLC